MKISAVICEYNPFHNGHKYLNETAKADCDALVAVMSSSFTQRGDTAIFSKHERAGAALKNGVDLVLELPVVYAVSPAQCFAESGIAMISALGCVDRLVFGSECGSTVLLQKAADALESNEVNALIKQKMDKGLYYPRALSEAAGEIFGSEIMQILSSPNDILGVEYCRALRNTGIEPYAIKRKGTAHDSAVPSDGFASASHIRSLIKNGGNADIFLPEKHPDDSAFLNNLDRAILYRLRMMSIEEIAALPDVSEGLENRIFAAVRSESTLEDILEKVKTKRYTMARLRRIFICALLGITDALRKIPVPYIRILGFNSRGAEILKLAKFSASLPIITKIPSAMKELPEDAKKILEAEITASDIWALARRSPLPCGADFTEPLIII